MREDEEIVYELDISNLMIQGDTPVDNLQSKKQQRLLVEPLYSFKVLPSPFLAAASNLENRTSSFQPFAALAS